MRSSSAYAQCQSNLLLKKIRQDRESLNFSLPRKKLYYSDNLVNLDNLVNFELF